MKKILYIDMDWVLANFEKWVQKFIKKWFDEKEVFKNLKWFFSELEPIDWALEAFEELYPHFEIFILSTAPWSNNFAWSEKVAWVKKYLWEKVKKRVILTHRKDLNIWDFLVDDRLANWSSEFKWEFIHFWQKWFENWEKVKDYLLSKK